MNNNKIIFLSFFLTLINFFTVKGTETRLLSLVIGPSSHIIINGNTNISSFSCHYSNNIADSVNIKIRKLRNKLEIDNAQLAIPIEYINCNNIIMNNDLRKLLDADKYPYILINIYDVDEKTILSDDNNSSIVGLGRANIKVTIAGKTNKYYIDFMDQRKKNEIIITGTVKLNLQNYGIEPPEKVFGVIKVREDIEIEILLRLYIDSFNYSENISSKVILN